MDKLDTEQTQINDLENDSEEERVGGQVEQTEAKTETATKVEEEKRAIVEPEAVFRLTAKADRLRSILRAVNSIGDDITFAIRNDRVIIRQMDEMHVSMVDATLEKPSFMEYIVTKEGNITVNVPKLRAVMKRADADENVTLRTVGAKVEVTTGDRVFNLSTYENFDECPIPKLALKTHTRVNTKAFIESLEDVGLAESDRVALIVKTDDVRVQSVGDDVDATVHLKKGALDTYAESEVKSQYSNDYLPKIVKASSALADDFLLEIDADMPARMTFRPTSTAVLMFYLAPYIEA